MKKVAVLGVALMSVVATVKAQSVTWGVKAGVQSNSLSIKNETGGNWSRLAVNAAGFHAGGVADFMIGPNFSIQPNLLFSMKSTRPSNTQEFTLYTVDLPINFLYRHNGLFVGAGPNLSYGISAKQEQDGQPDNDLYEPDGPLPAEFNRFELGLNAVLGYQFSSGLTVNAHYTPGFSNLNNRDNADEQRWNTRVFGLSVGYMFGKNKSTAK